MSTRLNEEEKRLIRRYLLWCYKVTKEGLDRIDRKFTQLVVDYDVLRQLTKHVHSLSLKEKGGYLKNLKEFKRYVQNKKQDALAMKFKDRRRTTLHPQYRFLKSRLLAIEHSIRLFLGKEELRRIRMLYEREMIERILKAQEHT